MTRPAHQSNFIKKLLASRLFLFLISLALIGLAVNVGRESYRKYQLTKEINQLKSEISRLEKQDNQMADLLEYFQEDTYLEKEARLKLNLKKPGEKVVIFSQTEEATASQSPADSKETGQPSQEDESNPWKWWEYFFLRD